VGSPQIKILIRAVDQASAQLSNVGKAVKGLRDKFAGLKDVVKIAAGVMLRDLANAFTKSIGESFELAGKIDTLQASFNRLKVAAGATKLNLDKLREATKGTVADVDLLTAANQALALGLPADDLDRLFEAAMKLGHAMGIDTKAAVESLATGIGRQSKLILDNLGITFQASDAYEWYAEKIGKSVNELTESEKKLAWQQYAIKMVTKKANELGDVISDTQLQQERWNASLKNFQTQLGKIFAPLSGFYQAAQPFIPMFSTMAGMLIPQLITQMGGLSGVIASVKGAFAGLNAVLMANPIMLVVAAIGLLITTLILAYKHCKPFRDAVNAIGKAIADFLKPAVEALTNALKWLWNNILAPLGKFVKRFLVAYFKAWYLTLKAIYDYGVKPLADALMWLWHHVLEPLANFLKSTFKPILDTIGGALKGVADFIGGIGKALFGSPKTIFEDAAVGLKKMRRELNRLSQPEWMIAPMTVKPLAGGRGLTSVSVSGPLVYIAGSADRETAELAARLIQEKLRNVIIENTSSAAVTKRIMFSEGVI